MQQNMPDSVDCYLLTFSSIHCLTHVVNPEVERVKVVVSFVFGVHVQALSRAAQEVIIKITAKTVGGKKDV